jgi:hypothetical protein
MYSDWCMHTIIYARCNTRRGLDILYSSYATRTHRQFGARHTVVSPPRPGYIESRGRHKPSAGLISLLCTLLAHTRYLPVALSYTPRTVCGARQSLIYDMIMSITNTSVMYTYIQYGCTRVYPANIHIRSTIIACSELYRSCAQMCWHKYHSNTYASSCIICCS